MKCLKTNNDCRVAFSQAEYPRCSKLGFDDFDNNKMKSIYLDDWREYSKWLNDRTMKATNNLDIFRKEFLEANSWEQKKNGIPLNTLDALSDEELKIAEVELINVLTLKENWTIVGLGHIKSKVALPALYDLLDKSNGSMKVTIAHSIFQICQDPEMIEIVLETVPRIINQYELICVLYYLPNFKDKRITELHNNYINHKEYLVAFNATRSLGLPIAEVVEKFREKKS